MKRINIILAMVVVAYSLFSIQSCTKDNSTFTIYNAFTEPTVAAPVDGATIKITGTTVDLKWATTDKDGDTPVSDVYFGTNSKPVLYKAGATGLTLTVPVVLGATYYWHVTMKDANGVLTYGPTWSFTIFEPVSIYVGDFNCDEPAEDYSYDVSFTKGDATSVITGNYWNSGWAAIFTLDFTKLTYTMPLTTWSNYSAIESGTINATTGKMVGNYIIYYKGKSIEEGVHTYTKY